MNSSSRIVISVSLIVILILATSGYPSSKELLFRKYTTDIEKSINWDGYLLAENEHAAEESDQNLIDNSLYSGDQLKSTKAGFLYSIAMPGAGEFYCNSYAKAALFFAAELGFWAGYGVYNYKGKQKKDKFQNFADEYWDMEVYLNWLATTKNDAAWWWDDNSWVSDMLPLQAEVTASNDRFNIVPDDIKKNDDYYDMIGNIWFVIGWEDIDEVPPLEITDDNDDRDDYIIRELEKKIQPQAEYRQEYLDMEEKANQMYKYAKYFMGAAIFNHILSAFDAVWTVKKHNDEIQSDFAEINLRTRLVQQDNQMCPKVFLTFKLK